MKHRDQLVGVGDELLGARKERIEVSGAMGL
jgi:hypothetical protein